MNEIEGVWVAYEGRWDWVPTEQPNPPTPGAAGRWHVVQEQSGASARWEWVPATHPAPPPAPPLPPYATAAPAAVRPKPTLAPWVSLLAMIAVALGIGLLVAIAAPTTATGPIRVNPGRQLGHAQVLTPSELPGYSGRTSAGRRGIASSSS